MRHEVTLREMQNIHVNEVLASSIGRGEHKKLLFTYDIGRKRLQYIVEFMNDGKREYAYDTLEDAVEAYNEV